MGYPQHACLVEGHLDQAAAEAVLNHPSLAVTIRTFRIAWSKAFESYIRGTPCTFPNEEELMEELHNTRIEAVAKTMISEEPPNEKDSVPGNC